MKLPHYPKPKTPLTAPSPQRKEAFTKAYKSKFTLLVSIIHGMTGDWEKSQDIAQETWTAAYKCFSTEQFEHIGLLRAKARQIIVDKYRYNKTREFLSFTDNLETQPIVYRPRNFIGTAEEAALKQKMLEEFQEAFTDEIDKECFWLRFQYGFTIKELAERFDIKQSTMHDRLTRIRESCRQIFSNL